MDPGAPQTNPFLGPMMPGSVLSTSFADQAAPKPLHANIFVIWAAAGFRQMGGSWKAPDAPS